MNKLTDLQKGYIAGIIDGEGCILVRQRKRPYGFTYDPSLIITNTHLGLLEYLVNITNIGKIYKQYYSKAHQESNSKQGYRWEISSNNMRLLLPVVHPYLVVKQEQCTLVIRLLQITHPYVKASFDTKMSSNLYIKR